jgi:hypothetical protein
LSGRAFDLLDALMQRRDRVVPKQELLDVVWPGLIVERTTCVHVMNLRKLLGAQSILTVSGRGYQFTLKEDAAAPSRPRPSRRSRARPPRSLRRSRHVAHRRDRLIASTCALLRRDDRAARRLSGPEWLRQDPRGLTRDRQLAQTSPTAAIVMLAPVRDPLAWRRRSPAC